MRYSTDLTSLHLQFNFVMVTLTIPAEPIEPCKMVVFVCVLKLPYPIDTRFKPVQFILLIFPEFSGCYETATDTDCFWNVHWETEILFSRFAGRPGKYNKLFNRWRLEEVSSPGLCSCGISMSKKEVVEAQFKDFIIPSAANTKLLFLAKDRIHEMGFSFSVHQCAEWPFPRPHELFLPLP